MPMNREKTLKNLRTLIEESRDQFWPVASFLHGIQARDTSWFPEAADAVGIGRRRAFTLTKIFTTFSRMSVPVTELELVGWTKLAVIAGHVDKNPAKLAELLHMAKTLSSRDLNLKLGGATDDASHTVLLTLNDVAFAKFEQYLLKFGAQRNGRGLSDKELALSKLLQRLDDLEAALRVGALSLPQPK